MVKNKEMKKEVIIEYKVEINELLKVSKYLLLNSRVIIIPVFVIIFFILTQSIEFIDNNKISSEATSSISDYSFFMFFIIIWTSIYFRLVHTMKQNIVKNKKNLEKQTITFNAESYIQQGKTFKIESFWNETYQIKETKSWFLIYPRKNFAFPLIKSDLTQNQYSELKELFNSLKINKSLK